MLTEFSQPRLVGRRDSTMRRGFTLVELLIAIAVIAILAALIFPVLTSVRERGKSAQCISNLRQIGVGVSSYLADWDNRYPWAANDIGLIVEHLRPSFYQTMSAYVPGKVVWQCPSDVGRILPKDAIGGLPLHTPPFWSDTMSMSSYSYNGFANRCGPGDWFVLAGRRAAEIKQPSVAELSCEAQPWHDRGNVDDKPSMGWFDKARVNVVYCDGHVAKRTQAEWIKGSTYSPIP